MYYSVTHSYYCLLLSRSAGAGGCWFTSGRAMVVTMDGMRLYKNWNVWMGCTYSVARSYFASHFPQCRYWCVYGVGVREPRGCWRMLIHFWTGDGGDYGWDVLTEIGGCFGFGWDTGLCVNSQWHNAKNHSIFSTAEIIVSHMAKVWGPMMWKFGGLWCESWGLGVWKSK